jgi:hypothetical protein
LIEQFVAARDVNYRGDVGHDAARLQNLESTMLAALELLRDQWGGMKNIDMKKIDR